MTAGGQLPVAAPEVALTFDVEHPSRAHHDPAAPDRVLDALRDRDVAATFFVQARYARAFPAIARRVVDEGHLLGNHSHHHAHMTLLTDEGVRSDVRAAEATLLEVTGVDPRPWFRLPFGDGHDDPRVLALLDELGYVCIHWDVDSGDYLDATGPQDLVRGVVESVLRRRGGSVVLLHTWPALTGRLLGALVDALTAAGATFTRVDRRQGGLGGSRYTA